MFIDNPHTPLIYADAASGWSIAAGNVRVTLEVMHINHSDAATMQETARVVVAKLAMPLETAVSMARGILQLAEQQRRVDETAAADLAPAVN